MLKNILALQGFAFIFANILIQFKMRWILTIDWAWYYQLLYFGYCDYFRCVYVCIILSLFLGDNEFDNWLLTLWKEPKKNKCRLYRLKKQFLFRMLCAVATDQMTVDKRYSDATNLIRLYAHKLLHHHANV